MEVNGKDDLMQPLMKSSDSVAVSISQPNHNGDAKIKTVMFKIRGIECASCSNSIESVVGKLSGVVSVMVSPLEGQAVVRYMPDLINAKTIKETVKDTGFEVDDFPEQDVAVCRLRIKGMACTSCSESVERALLMVEGVKKAVVGLALEEAKVHFDPNVTDSNRIIEAVEDAGFGADLISSGSDVNKVHLMIEGINSPEDLTVIKLSLESLEGVNHVDMDLEGHKVTVSYDPDITGPRSVIQCICEAGSGTHFYQASFYSPPRRRETEREHEIQMYRTQFWWSCLFSVPVFVFSMILPMLPPYGDWLDYKVHNMLTVGMFLRWILCTPVQFIIGRRFYVGSYHALRRRSANMDVLVALGTNAAYFYSLYIVIKALTSYTFEGEDFFETSAMLISFILLGKYLEVVAKGKTSDALAKLTDLAPETACLLTLDDDGNVISEMEISTQLLQRNDVIKIVPGAKIPVDGVVINGQSHVNESMITGEARPIAKRPGDKVIGGTMNENGCLLVKATHVGPETALSQIVQLVEAAQLARAPVQKLADQISRFFVPTVVVAAFLTWLGWFVSGEAGIFPKSWIPEDMDAFELALQFGISVLVVACPCALGLATPTAVMVATGKGASQGVLIKGGNALEKAHKVNTVVFDKTGTLTTGEFMCKAIEPIHGHMENGRGKVASCCIPTCEKEALAVAAAMEKGTTHPIGRAVVDHSVGQELPSFSVESFENLPGRGLFATLSSIEPGLGGGEPLKASLGSVEFITSLFNSEDESKKIVEAVSTSSHGSDFVHAALSVNNKKVTLFHLEDKLRTGAMDVILALQGQAKLHVIMLTGDHESSAWRVANAIGINEVYCNLKPEDKLSHVTSISKDTGGGLIMVGDGINDAPALAAATVGAVLAQRASATAIAVADVLLLQDNISGVPFCIAKSRQTTSLVKQNVALALSSIVLASFTSVLGFLPLWLTVLLHEGGTLLVCLNSIRALNNPTSSWRQNLVDTVAKLKSIIMVLRSSGTRPGTIQASLL